MSPLLGKSSILQAGLSYSISRSMNLTQQQHNKNSKGRQKPSVHSIETPTQCFASLQISSRMKMHVPTRLRLSRKKPNHARKQLRTREGNFGRAVEGLRRVLWGVNQNIKELERKGKMDLILSLYKHLYP